jgi:hypothetical protein
LGIIQEEYEEDGLLVVMIMLDGTPADAAALAEEAKLSIPVLVDPQQKAFDRWDPQLRTPDTAFIKPGMEVHMTGATWHPALIEEVLGLE